MAIWEENGITLEEYAKTFNEVIDDAYDRSVKGKCYMVSQTEPLSVRRIVNIKVPHND